MIVDAHEYAELCVLVAGHQAAARVKRYVPPPLADLTAKPQPRRMPKAKPRSVSTQKKRAVKKLSVVHPKAGSPQAMWVEIGVGPPQVMLQALGETMSLRCWSRKVGVHMATLYSRITTLGWSIERALTTPPKRQGK